MSLLFIFSTPLFHVNNTIVYADQASRSAEPQFISDDETEAALETWLKELFIVAGIHIPPKVFLLNSMELNAGATFGGIIIVYAGLIIKCKDASQLLGVLAHETGHIAGGHMAKASAAVTESSVPAFASILLGSAATILTGNPGALMAGLAGGAQIFERSLLRHSREQEDSADASALRYLNAKHWPVKGLADFLDMLGNHYTTGHEDPYVQSHPLSPERKAKVRLFQKEQPASYKVPDAYEQQFKRIKAKLFGFLKKQNEVLREYPKSDKSIAARYARLIADYNKGKSHKKAHIALKKLDRLLREVPGDPYFLELKGQFCFETGQIAKALPYLRQSMIKGVKSNNIRLMLAHALIELPNASSAELHEAIENLTKITEKNHEAHFAWRLMGSAYGKLNETGNAAACLAEEAWILEKPDLAVMQAKKGKTATNPVLAKRSGDILQQAGLADKDKKQ
ncbi:MAG: M48 family metalloprotease [Candidatus Paracaedibacteraceae bacterium]|nr:M48 family metalloprotease [Candidatus Paracaedibacteraceae bacterium]